MTALSPILCFETEVARVQRLSPSFTRVTFSGESLSRLDGCGSLGPRDLRVKVIVPVRGEPPAFVETGEPGWYQRWLQVAPERRGEMRTYTVRAVRLDAAPPEVDVDFVLHAHDCHSGPAAAWAQSASVGFCGVYGAEASRSAVCMAPRRRVLRSVWRRGVAFCGRGRAVLTSHGELLLPMAKSPW